MGGEFEAGIDGDCLSYLGNWTSEVMIIVIIIKSHIHEKRYSSCLHPRSTLFFSILLSQKGVILTLQIVRVFTCTAPYHPSSQPYMENLIHSCTSTPPCSTGAYVLSSLESRSRSGYMRRFHTTRMQCSTVQCRVRRSATPLDVP